MLTNPVTVWKQQYSNGGQALKEGYVKLPNLCITRG